MNGSGFRGIITEYLLRSQGLDCRVSLFPAQRGVGGRGEEDRVGAGCFCGALLFLSLLGTQTQRSPEGPRHLHRIPRLSHVVSGKSGILLSCEGSLGIPLELVQGTSASSRFEAGNSGFLSSSDKDLVQSRRPGFYPKLRKIP